MHARTGLPGVLRGLPLGPPPSGRGRFRTSHTQSENTRGESWSEHGESSCRRRYDVVGIQERSTADHMQAISWSTDERVVGNDTLAARVCGAGVRVLAPLEHVSKGVVQA